MAKALPVQVFTEEKISSTIHLIRDKKIMLDYDLAELYGVETKQLKRQVKRNADRFPDDFMFELAKEEYLSLRSQSGTLKRGQHAKYLPYAFTEQGVAMLSSVLGSATAIQVNIQIIRVFSKMRELLQANKDILLQLERIEKKLLEHDIKMQQHDGDIAVIFEALKNLLQPEKPENRNRIGFKP